MTTRNQPYTRQLVCTLFAATGIALLISLGSWCLETDADAAPVYLLHLPYWVGLPFLLLGGPVALIPAPERYVRIYSRGAILLAVGLAGAWCVAAVIDPSATHGGTQTGLLCGWLAGGTAYEVLLLFLVANA